VICAVFFCVSQHFTAADDDGLLKSDSASACLAEIFFRGVQILIAFFFVCEKLAAARNKLLIYVPLLKSSLRRETYCAREVVKRRIIVMCVPNCTSFLILLDRFISLFRRKNPSREEENNTRSIFPSDKSSGSRHEPTVQSVWGACCGLSFRSVYLRRMQGELLSARKKFAAIYDKSRRSSAGATNGLNDRWATHSIWL
jgi:hypothetical protein